MRSALIVATFSLSILAVPIPEAQPIYKSSELGQNDRPDLNDRVQRRGLQIEARSPALSRNKDARDIEFEARSPALSRNRDARDIQSEARSPALSRNKNAREVEVETRSPTLSRNRDARGIDNEDDIAIAEDLETRYTRSGSGLDRRSADEDLDARYMRAGKLMTVDEDYEARQGSSRRSAVSEPLTHSNGKPGTRDVEERSAEAEPKVRGPRIKDSVQVTDKRTAEPDPKVRGPRVFNSDERDAEVINAGQPSEKRTAEAEPINRIYGSSGPTRWDTRAVDAETEPFGHAGAGRRSAEAEPGFTRAKPGGRRSAEAEPGFTRAKPGGRRSAEAEPGFTRAKPGGRRSAEAEPGFTRAKPGGRRSAEAEPGFTRAKPGGRRRSAEPGKVRPPQKRTS